MSTQLDPIGQVIARRETAASEATKVEQSRAIAEVQSAVVVAQQCPRDVPASLSQMRESCRMLALASRAFFSYRRGGGTISGPSIHLARELARCWGNVQYGISELGRDDERHVSEMSAWAWDVQTNTRSAHTFLVPHKRDTQKGVVPIVDLRDVYENNANMGARRVREAIFSVLPAWYTEEAQQLCQETLEKGDGQTLAARVTKAAELLDAIGVSLDRVEAKVGRRRQEWTAGDVARLGVSYQSIQQGTVSVSEEFPSLTKPVTVAELDPTVEPGFGAS
jgi:hypothetical protein